MGFGDEIEELILNGDYEEAKIEILKPSNENFVEQDGMNLMTRVFDIGLRTACTQEQIRASTDILCHLTRVMSPKEALITILEQIEVVGLDHKLYCVLEPLEIALEKLPTKWETNLKWVLETLEKRIHVGEKPLELEYNERNQLSAVELRAAEAEEGCLRVQVYNPVEGFLKFYEYCLNHTLNTVKDPETVREWKNILRDKVLSLLGCLKLWPFRYPNEENSGDVITKMNKSTEPAETEAFRVACKVVELLDKLGTTVRFYHEWLQVKIDELREKSDKKDQDVLTDDEDETDTIPDIDLTSLVSYFYVVYGQNLNGSHRHGPSSPTFEIYTGFFLVSNLFNISDSVEVHIKGLSVAQFLLNQLCPRSPFHRLLPELLDTKVHEEFFRQVSNAFTYSECAEVRRLGAFVFKSYLWAFNSAGRHKFIKTILYTSNYSDSIYGFIITQLKEFVRQALEKIEGKKFLASMGQDEPLLPLTEVYFTGKNLQLLLQPCINLPNGPNTDLMSCDNQILSTLNLIRFILIRDGKKNLSGFNNYLSEINEKFLKNLRKAVDLAILQAKSRLKELEDPETVRREMTEAIKSKWDVVVSDSQGNPLPEPQNFSVEEQTASCKGVLSKMDLMECVLAHTNELCETALKANTK